jgi:methyltransferase
MLPALVVTIVVVQRLSELMLANRNYRWAMRHGGREYGADHYWLFVVLHSLWLICMAAESLILKPTVPIWWPLWLVLIATAQVLRYWAITTLGRCWNTRIIVFDGMPRVTTGPYRYLNHPNYVAVVLEIAAIPMLVGAWRTALLCTIANGALLLLVRIPAEERVLKNQHLSSGKVATVREAQD